MKILMLVHEDGGRCKGPTVPDDFDTQAWAQSKLSVFNTLKITLIEEIQL